MQVSSTHPREIVVAILDPMGHMRCLWTALKDSCMQDGFEPRIGSEMRADEGRSGCDVRWGISVLQSVNAEYVSLFRKRRKEEVCIPSRNCWTFSG